MNLLEIFQYADNWDDARITRHVTRMYARKAYVKSATSTLDHLYVDRKSVV